MRLRLLVFLVGVLIAKSIVALSNTAVNSDTTSTKKINLYKAVGYTTAYYAGSIYLLGNTWYKDKKVVPFHIYNDNRGYLQVDKFGHTFGSYVYSYIGYHYLLNSGFSKKNALWYGATLGTILQTPIEIMDGVHEGYGFSLGDMVANMLGSSIVFSQAAIFDEQIVKYKFSYWESSYSRKANGYLGTSTLNRVLKDYNGHTYWLSIPINKIIFNSYIPKWLCISTGYGANGMYGEFKNINEYKGVAIPNTERYRQYLLSLDIDWTKINTRSKFLKLILKGMTFVKLPFPALELNSKKELKGYWLYY